MSFARWGASSGEADMMGEAERARVRLAQLRGDGAEEGGRGVS